MTDKKTIREQQAEIDKLKQALKERDAAEQVLRQMHEKAVDDLAKLNARPVSTQVGGDSEPTLSMDQIVTRVLNEVKKASNTDADSEDSGDESDSSYIGATSETYDSEEFNAVNTRYIERAIGSSLRKFENYDGREDRHGRLVFSIRAAFRNNNMPEIVDQKNKYYKRLISAQPGIAKVQSRVMRSILGMLVTEGQAYVKYKAALRDPGNKTDSRGLWKAFTSAFILTDPDSAIDAIEAGIADLHWEGGDDLDSFVDKLQDQCEKLVGRKDSAGTDKKMTEHQIASKLIEKFTKDPDNGFSGKERQEFCDYMQTYKTTLATTHRPLTLIGVTDHLRHKLCQRNSDDHRGRSNQQQGGNHHGRGNAQNGKRCTYCGFAHDVKNCRGKQEDEANGTQKHKDKRDQRDHNRANNVPGNGWSHQQQQQGVCHTCGQPGHWARECPNGGKGGKGGKGKGGKGGKGGSGAFNGNCHSCGQWGHRAQHCGRNNQQFGNGAGYSQPVRQQHEQQYGYPVHTGSQPQPNQPQSNYQLLHHQAEPTHQYQSDQYQHNQYHSNQHLPEQVSDLSSHGKGRGWSSQPMAGNARPGYTGPAAGQGSRYYDGYAMVHKGVKVEARASSSKPLGSTEVFIGRSAFIGHNVMCAQQHPNGDSSFIAPPSCTFLVSDEQAREILVPLIAKLNAGARGATTGFIEMRNSKGDFIRTNLRVTLITIDAIAALVQEVHIQHARNLLAQESLTATVPNTVTNTEVTNCRPAVGACRGCAHRTAAASLRRLRSG